MLLHTAEDASNTDELRKKHQKLVQQHRRFNNLEADKRYFASETGNYVKKQRLIIQRLRRENEGLKETIVESKGAQHDDRGFTEVKETLGDIVTAINEEKETQKSIEIHVANFQKKIVEKKKITKGVNSGAQNQSNLQKQIKILENRLDKANQKYNETIAVNKELKIVIDSLRKERVIFDNLYKKLEGQLHEREKKMAEIVEKANNAYEDRDKVNMQIGSLKEQAKRQAGEFEKEIKEITGIMEKIKVNSYLKKTGKPTESVVGLGGFPESEQETAYEPRNVKQTKKSSEQMEQIQKYRDDFSKIQAATKIKKFDELFRIFSENEEKNFELFKFVNLQSNEIQELENEVSKLREETRDVERVTMNPKDKYLVEMEEKLKRLTVTLKEVEEQYKAAQKETKSFSSIIDRIFQTIECDRQVAKEISGGKMIFENNLLVFLGIIQYKTTQIVSTFKQLSNAAMIAQEVRTNHQESGVLVFEEFEEKDNVEYERQLEESEFRMKAKEFLLNKEQKQKKKQVRPRKK